MAEAGKFDRTIFLAVLVGVLLGAAGGVTLTRWVVPVAASFRPAVLSTVVVPLGCFVGWVLSPSREPAHVAAWVCFGLYFLSTFAAARLGTFFPGWDYFGAVLWVQSGGGIALAIGLSLSGRAVPGVEQLLQDRDAVGLAGRLGEGTPDERLAAVQALALLGGQEAASAFLQALEDDDARVRRAAIGALVGRAVPDDVPRLEAALSDADGLVRRRSLEALRWIESKQARGAAGRYWGRTLEVARGRVWLRTIPLLLGALLLFTSLLLPWAGGSTSVQGPLWGFAGGPVVTLLLALTAVVAPIELVWGIGRRDLTGHLERLRLWVFLPLGVLFLALLWPLEGFAILEAQGWFALGPGFGVAGAGAVLEILGTLFIHG